MDIRNVAGNVCHGFLYKCMQSNKINATNGAKWTIDVTTVPIIQNVHAIISLVLGSFA